MPKKEEYEHPYLNHVVRHADVVSFELDDLIKGGLVESIWCKISSDAGGANERFVKILPAEIDVSALAWEKCDSSKGLLFGVIRHYLIVLREGYIPSEYLTKE